MQDVGCIQMGGQAALIAQLSPLCPAKALFSFNYLSILKRCQTKRSWQGLALREQCGGCKEGAYSRELLQEGWMSCPGWLLRLVRRHRGGSLWQDFRTEPVPCAPSAPSGSERLVLCTDTPRQTVPQERRCSARPHRPATDTPAQPQQRGREPSRGLRLCLRGAGAAAGCPTMGFCSQGIGKVLKWRFSSDGSEKPRLLSWRFCKLKRES